MTSHDFSWLQNGQLNSMSRGSIAFRLGGGLLAFLRRPMTDLLKRKQSDAINSMHLIRSPAPLLSKMEQPLARLLLRWSFLALTILCILQ